MLIELAAFREEMGSTDDVEELYRWAADAGLGWEPAITVRWPHGLDPDGTPTQPWPIQIAKRTAAGNTHA